LWLLAGGGVSLFLSLRLMHINTLVEGITQRLGGPPPLPRLRPARPLPEPPAPAALPMPAPPAPQVPPARHPTRRLSRRELAATLPLAAQPTEHRTRRLGATPPSRRVVR